MFFGCAPPRSPACRQDYYPDRRFQEVTESSIDGQERAIVVIMSGMLLPTATSFQVKPKTSVPGLM